MLPRLARIVVRVAALRAPSDKRAEMRAEWDAELEREFSRGGGWGVVLAAWGAFADARAMRQLGRLEGGTTMGETLAGFRDDVRTALRGLGRAPGFTAVTVLTLAVGIGGAAAIYTLLDRVVIDPLPYPEADRLVRLENRVPAVSPDEMWQLSTAQWVHYSDRAQTLEEVGLFRPMGGNVTTASGAVRVRGVRVTASTVRMLGAQARLGRVIDDGDDTPEAPQVVMLSHDFWSSALGADPDVVGTSLILNDVSFDVVGVLEPGVNPPGLPVEAQPDVWTALNIDRAGPFQNNHVFPALARMVPGATAVEVEGELGRLALELPQAFPDAYSEGFIDSGFRTAVTPLKEHVLGDLARNLWLLFGGVGLVLLIAAANVANLFLVRVEGKRRELGIRAALGAGRGRVARFLLAEGLCLALVGGFFALVVGYWAVPAITALAPSELPRIQGVGIDLDTAVFTLVVSLLVGVLIAVVPMAEGARSTAAQVLTEAGRSTSAGRAQRSLRTTLVATQMALALTLLVGAGMLLQSLERLQSTDPGFDPEGVLAVDLHLTQVRYPDDVALWGFYSTALERIRALPGVAAVGLGEGVPVSGGYGCTVQGFEEEVVYQRLNDAGHTTCAGQLRVTPGYFDALGIELLEGRLLEEGDLEDPRRAAVVVSKAAADRFWPGEPAIGKGIGAARTIEPFHRVVGVVDDVFRASDDGVPPLSQTAIAVYYPVVDNPDVPGNWWWWPGDMTLVVRASGADAMALLPAIRDAVFEVDPEVPIANARLMEDVVADALVYVSFMSLLLSLAAAVALTLAAIGLYGVISYVVSRRTREIGMRLAIGAQPREVEGMVVRQTLGMLMLGLALGLPLAIGASNVGSSVLVGVEPMGVAAYLAAAALMAMIALVASWLPARRAAGVDPVEALRSE